MHQFKRASHAVFALHAHIVLTPKYRRKVFGNSGVHSVVIHSIASTCATLSVALEAIETDQDHLHALIGYQPALSLSVIVQRLKGASSRAVRIKQPAALRQMLWGKHFWSPGYCVISCGGAPLETTKRYVEQQGKMSLDPSLKEGGCG